MFMRMSGNRPSAVNLRGWRDDPGAHPAGRCRIGSGTDGGYPVVSTAELDERMGNQKSVRLPSIQSLASPVSFRELELLVQLRACGG